ncbi:MAG: FecR domain-containing protein [Pseudomonadota bacterium]
MKSSEKSQLDVKREAYEWCLLLDESTEPSPEDRRRFDAWVQQNPLHKAAYDRAAVAYRGLGKLELEQLDPDVRVVRKTTGVEPPIGRRADVARESRVTRPVIYGLQVAAVIAGIAFFIGNRAIDAPIDRAETVEYVAGSYETVRGEVRSLTLGDGSMVTLAPASELTVSMAADSRRLTLARGAARFDVARDPDRPFTVVAGSVSATALGTVFEVRHNGGTMRVAVEEGRVAFERSLLVAGMPTGVSKTMELEPGDFGVAQAGSPDETFGKVSINDISAWRDARLSYEAATLQELVADANRYSELPVHLTGDLAKLEGLRITASFDGNNVDEMLTTFPAMFPVSVDRTSKERVLITII